MRPCAAANFARLSGGRADKIPRVMTDLTDFLNAVASAEDWAGFGADGREPEEPMKRFTIDVPVALHRRIKAACARRGLKPSSVLRDLLEREFPETSGQFRPL